MVNRGKDGFRAEGECLSDQSFLVMHLSRRKWASLVVQRVKNLPAMQETLVQSLDWEDSPGLQYSCLEKPMDRGALWAMAHGVPKSRTLNG